MIKAKHSILLTLTLTLCLIITNVDTFRTDVMAANVTTDTMKIDDDKNEFTIIVNIDGNLELKKAIAGKTIGDILNELQVTKGISLFYAGTLTENVFPDQVFVFSKAAEVKELEEIPFQTQMIPTTDLLKGQGQTMQVGLVGTKEKTFKVYTIDGQEHKELIKEEILKAPVHHIIFSGTKEPEPIHPMAAEPSTVPTLAQNPAEAPANESAAAFGQQAMTPSEQAVASQVHAQVAAGQVVDQALVQADQATLAAQAAVEAQIAAEQAAKAAAEQAAVEAQIAAEQAAKAAAEQAAVEAQIAAEQAAKVAAEQAAVEAQVAAAQAAKAAAAKNNPHGFDYIYLKKLSMTATAYNSGPKSTGKKPGQKGYGLTYSGIPAGPGIVAVDPKVIPLGTRLYIEGYGFALAADTGSSIKGNKIDVYIEDANEIKKFGRRTVEVYVLE